MGYRAGKLDVAARRPVLSIVSGDHVSPFRGRGLEFEEVREYVHGDDVRNIDWRVTARTGRPHLKLFAEERERSVLICTDLNPTMRFGTRGTFKSIQAARAAALLGWSASRDNNRIGGSFFGNVSGGMMFIDPARSRKSLWRMLKQLCDQAEYSEERVALEDHLRYLAKATPSGALVFIISDFMVQRDDLKKQLSRLHRHADVVLVAVNDPADAFLPSAGALIFTGRGDEKLTVNTADRKGAEGWARLWQENRSHLRNVATALGLGLIELSTDRDVALDLASGVRSLRRRGGFGHGRPARTAS